MARLFGRSDTFYPGTTVDIVLEVFVEGTSQKIDADGFPTVDIRDPAGNIVQSNQTMTRESTGTYVYNHTTQSSDVDGTYTAICTADVATGATTRNEIKTVTFVLRRE